MKEQNKLKESAGLQIAGLFYQWERGGSGKSGGCGDDVRWRGRRGWFRAERELIRLKATGDGSHHSKDEATTRNGDDGGFVTHNPACNPHIIAHCVYRYR